MKSHVKSMGRCFINEPMFGDLILNLFPIRKWRKNKVLPIEFSNFQLPVNRIMDLIPHDPQSDNNHFVTIDSKFFTREETLRRPGIHIDGNFCGDPTFSYATWGGTTTTWGGTTTEPNPDRGINEQPKWIVKTNWVSPYGITPPLGTYVSDKLGGFLCVSTYEGCRVFPDDLVLEVGNEGDLEHHRKLLSKSKNFVLKPGVLYFLSSNTPHESLPIPQGIRRTLIRVTLSHDYNNRLILNRREP